MNENNFSDKLSEVLSDPQSMEKVLSVAKSLGLSGGASTAAKKGEAAEKTPVASDLGSMLPTLLGEIKNAEGESEKSGEKTGGLGALLEQPELKRLFGKGGKERNALLASLKPFLRDGRKDKLEDILRILRMVDLLYG